MLGISCQTDLVIQFSLFTKCRLEFQSLEQAVLINMELSPFLLTFTCLKKLPNNFSLMSFNTVITPLSRAEGMKKSVQKKPDMKIFVKVHCHAYLYTVI